MWIQCLVERKGPFTYDVPNGDGTFTHIPFERAANSGAQLAEVKNPAHVQFLLEERGEYFREWKGPKPDGRPPMILSHGQMLTGIVSRAKQAAAAAAKPKAPERKAPASSPNVMRMEGEELREYAKSIGMTRLPPPSVSDDTLRRAILELLDMKHQADVEDLTPPEPAVADDEE